MFRAERRLWLCSILAVIRAGKHTRLYNFGALVTACFDGDERSPNRCLHRRSSTFCAADPSAHTQNHARWLPALAGDDEVESTALRLQRNSWRDGRVQRPLRLWFLEGRVNSSWRFAGSGDPMGSFWADHNVGRSPPDRVLLGYVRKAAELTIRESNLLVPPPRGRSPHRLKCQRISRQH